LSLDSILLPNKDTKLGTCYLQIETMYNVDCSQSVQTFKSLSEKLDDKILRKYVRQYIDDIFVEFGEQPSILINIDTRQYFFNIVQ
jgi:hypothetical protein